MDKTITLREKTWKELIDLKYEFDFPTIDDVITALLKFKKQVKKR